MAVKRPLATALATVCGLAVLCEAIALFAAHGLVDHLIDAACLLVDLFCAWLWLVRRAEAN